MNSAPLLAELAIVTTTLPVVAPAGTLTVILFALQLIALPALVPLKVTVLLPWLLPKLLPMIVTADPTFPVLGLKPVIEGVETTVNIDGLLAIPPTVTSTFPVAAPAGTLTVILFALQLIALPALVPLKVTVLLPWLLPKLLPMIVTADPTFPVLGLKPVIEGVETTVNIDGLLAIPPTVTSTFPVAAPTGTLTVIPFALQLIALPALVPLKVTVLYPGCCQSCFPRSSPPIQPVPDSALSR